MYRFPTAATRGALTYTIESEQCYYKVEGWSSYSSEYSAITRCYNSSDGSDYSVTTVVTVVTTVLLQVRCRATHCLTKVANSMAASWDGEDSVTTVLL